MSRIGRSPVEAEFDSPDFIDEKDRFRGDFINEERKKRTQMIQKQQRALELKRSQFREQECLKDAKLDAEFRNQQNKEQKRRERSLQISKNNSSVQFDIITFSYSKTGKLKLQDSENWLKLQARAQRLFKCSKSTDYDIITGKGTKFCS